MPESEHKEDLALLHRMIMDYRSATLTTISPQGWVRSRPMITQQPPRDLDLWFATAYESDKVHDIERNPNVGVTYYRPEELFYVSVSGRAEIVRDRARIRQLWNAGWAEWFPLGPDEPNLALVRVRPEHVEYWDKTSGRMAVLFSTAKGASGGRPSGGNQLRERKAGESRAGQAKHKA